MQDNQNPYAFQPEPRNPVAPPPAAKAPAPQARAPQEAPAPAAVAAPPEPGQSYKVQVACDQQVAGKCDMTVSPTGVVFQWKKPLIGKALRIEKDWSLVRQVKNRLAEKKPGFELNVGDGKADRLMKVRVLEGDVPWLSQFLDGLGEDCFLPKCPRCGGAVVGRVCKQCHQNVAGAYRTQGLIAIFVGIGLIILGIVATIASYESARPGGSYTIWYGACVVGAISLLRGLYQIISGSR